MKKLFLIMFLIVGFLIIRCGDNSNGGELDCTGVISTYNGAAKLVIDKNCSVPGCHDAKFKSGNIDLSSYIPTSTYLKSPSNKFLCSIKHESGCSKMPQDIAPNKMDPNESKILECWIKNGFPE